MNERENRTSAKLFAAEKAYDFQSLRMRFQNALERASDRLCSCCPRGGGTASRRIAGALCRPACQAIPAISASRISRA